MMATISVEQLADDQFRVEVTDESSVTYHQVTARKDDVTQLVGGADPIRLIEASIEFLLEREPKESILGSFDLLVIGRYFPEYPSVIAERMAGGD